MSFKILNFIFFLLTFFGVFSCTPTNSQSITHPVFDISGEIIKPIVVNDAPYEQNFLSIINRLNNIRFSSHVDEKIILGDIVDAQFDQKNSLYVLDQSQLKIFQFSNSINPIDTLGAKGKGPGEFLFPTNIELDSTGENILVADLMRRPVIIQKNNSKLSKKIPTNALKKTYSDIKLSAKGVFLRRDMIVYPNSDLHLKTIDFLPFNSDTILYSFGEAYKSKHPLVVRNFSSGLLELMSESKLVISHNIHSPFIEAFNYNGKLVWKRKINGFKSFKMTYNEQRKSIQYHPDFTEKEKPFDEVVTLLSVDGKYLLIQLNRNSLSDRRKMKGQLKLKSYLIDTHLGEGVKIKDLPKVVAINSNLLFLHEKTEKSNYKVYGY